MQLFLYRGEYLLLDLLAVVDFFGFMQGLPERSRPAVKRDVLLPCRPSIGEKEILFRYAEFFGVGFGGHSIRVIRYDLEEKSNNKTAR